MCQNESHVVAVGNPVESDALRHDVGGELGDAEHIWRGEGGGVGARVRGAKTSEAELKEVFGDLDLGLDQV